MVQFVLFVEQIAVGLYIFCAAGVIWWSRSYLLARRQLHGAQFELEKELARFRLVNATTAIVIFVEIALAVLAISQVVAPTLRAQPPRAIAAHAEAPQAPFLTAAPNALLASTPPPNFAEGVDIPGLGDELNLQPFATPTLTPTPVGTIIPDVPPPIGCDTPGARLDIPANGMVVFAATTIVGSATTDNFAFYRFELNGPETRNVWGSLSEYTVPVINGELGQIIPSQLTPGEYKFRLSVFDISSRPQATCTITIFVSEPIPTPTPLRES